MTYYFNCLNFCLNLDKYIYIDMSKTKVNSYSSRNIMVSADARFLLQLYFRIAIENYEIITCLVIVVWPQITIFDETIRLGSMGCIAQLYYWNSHRFYTFYLSNWSTRTLFIFVWVSFGFHLPIISSKFKIDTNECVSIDTLFY